MRTHSADAKRGGSANEPERSRATEESGAGRETGETVFRVDGVTKTYENGDEAVRAVDDVSFSVRRGEIVGLLGPNGAGKTTTIKSALGMVIPDEGTAEVAGYDVYDRPREAYRRVEAMLEGARNLYWRLTVRENLVYFASIGGDDPAAIADHHERLLDELGLAEAADEEARRLSRGMKQKALVASTLARDVDVVVLDEPTLGLDVETALELRRILRRLADERDLTLVLSTHDMDVVEDVCDRVVVMDDGEVVADERVDALLDTFETRAYRVTVRGLDPGQVRALEADSLVTDVSKLDGRVRFEVTADSEAFYRFVAELRSLGARVDEVETVTPDMEEAFMSLTGGER